MRSDPSRLLSAAVLALAGCGGGAVQVEQAKSDLTRNLSPSVPAADAAELSAGNAAFAADLFKAVRGSGNTMISPHSISLALAMTYAGAKGATESAMAGTLRFTLPQDRLHPAFDQLDLALSGRGQGATGKDGKPFRLAIANAAWGQKDYSFEAAYLDTLAVSYGAGLNLLDFRAEPEPSRQTINRWVEQKTENRIKDLLSEGVITSDTRLVLTNAVYFNASWETKFKKEQTRAAAFQLGAGGSVQVPTLSGELTGSHADTAEFTAAQLPYQGGEIAMVVVLPKAGSLEAFEASLDGAKLQAIAAALSPAALRVELPKFKFGGKASLKDALTTLGMGVAFSDGADFSGIHQPSELTISDVIHQTFVAVDEDGTEAAAATAVVLDERAAMGTEFKADRPFLFLIRDLQTGAILFLGHVTDPR
ncbi:MAG TPA: serpin family protein [Myxococcales bacterium]|jgi:serpin B